MLRFIADLLTGGTLLLLAAGITFIIVVIAMVTNITASTFGLMAYVIIMAWGLGVIFRYTE